MGGYRADRGQGRLQQAAAIAGHPHRGPEQRPGRGRPESDYGAWLDRLDLRLQPWTAGLDLARAGRLMQTPLAARSPFEVLDRVGDVDRATLDPGFRQRPVEQPARRSDERLALWSSSSPGCSPTSISSARAGPSPKTVCVALPQRAHPRQVCAACRRLVRFPFLGRKSAAETSVFPLSLTHLTYPVKRLDTTGSRRAAPRHAGHLGDPGHFAARIRSARENGSVVAKQRHRYSRVAPSSPSHPSTLDSLRKLRLNRGYPLCGDLANRKHAMGQIGAHRRSGGRRDGARRRRGSRSRTPPARGRAPRASPAARRARGSPARSRAGRLARPGADRGPLRHPLEAVAIGNRRGPGAVEAEHLADFLQRLGGPLPQRLVADQQPASLRRGPRMPACTARQR